MVEHCSSNIAANIISRVGFAATIYHLWRERNNRRFRNVYLDEDRVINQIITDVSIRFSLLKGVSDTARNREVMSSWNLPAQYIQKTKIACSWTPPPLGVIKINTDGSLSSTKGGSGGVLRDEKGQPIAGFASATAPRTILHHELAAVHRGLEIAWERGYTKVLVATDSLLAVRMIEGRSQTAWQHRHTIQMIKTPSQNFESCSFVHVFRETNKVADFFASYGMMEGHCNVYEPCDFPDVIQDMIVKDTIGTIVLR